MCAASNGGGSHFAPTPANDPSSDDAYRSPYNAPIGSHSAPKPASETAGLYQGFSFEAPNGSHAAIDPTLPVPGSRRVSPSETDTFMAAAVRTAVQERPQPAAVPQHGVRTGETVAMPTSVRNAVAAGAGVAAAPSATTKSKPVNPLVAARAMAGTQQIPAQPTMPTMPAPAVQKTQSTPPVTPTGSLYPIQEVEDGKRGAAFDTTFAEGSHRRTALFVVLAILVVALVFAGIFFGLRYKEASDARAKIDDAIGRLRDSDGVIVPLDAAIAAEISLGVASNQLSNLMLQSVSTSTALSDAEQFANDAARASDLLSAEENDAIAAVKSSVAARRSMLEIGRMLLSTDTATTEALNCLAMAYGSIADSNAKIQSSADQFAAYSAALEANEDTSWYDPWGVVQLDNDALADLTVAQDWVNGAREAFGSANFAVLDNYLNARINQVNMLIQVDICVANGDMEGAANLAAGPYAEADANAQAAAAQVPATAAELLVGAYANATAAQRDAYDTARTKCVDADAVLNDYLGITDARKEMGVTGDSKATVAPTAQISDPVAPAEPQPAPAPEPPAPAPEEGVPEDGEEPMPEAA